MDNSTVEIMNRGIDCLIEKLEVVEAEQFIPAIMREKTFPTKIERVQTNNGTP